MLMQEKRCKNGFAFFKIIYALINKILVYILVFFIRIYQLVLSPLLPASCRFTPTCSDYTLEALRKYGLIKRANDKYPYEYELTEKGLKQLDFLNTLAHYEYNYEAYKLEEELYAE